MRSGPERAGQSTSTPCDRVTAFIGLGSNLAAPVSQLHRALQALSVLPDSRLLARSRFYRSRPMGPVAQPDFINAAAALETALAPLALLDALQAIEQAQGRVRGPQRWGPRTLDLDVLLYGAQIIDQPRLQVPHPGLPERNFVLYPLHDIAPGLTVPGQGPLDDLWRACSQAGLAPVAEEQHDKPDNGRSGDTARG